MDVRQQLDLIKIKGSYTYADIFLYNSYYSSNNFDSALDNLYANYEKLFEIGITLSAFQFVGIVLENNVALESDYIKIGYFILCLGFVISLFGTLLSYIAFTYINSIRGESHDFILEGIQKYKHFFKLSDMFLYIDSVLFIIPINLLIYNVLDFYYSLSFNIICGLLAICGISSHYLIIIKYQNYKYTKRNIL